MKKGWRKCRKCGVAKRPSAYSVKGRTHGPNGKPARGAWVCRACYAAAKKKRELELQRWYRHGRSCPRCGQRSKCPQEIGIAHNAVCKACARKHRAENARRRYQQDPMSNAEACRRWRAANPGMAAASSRRWRKKRKALFKQHPELREAHLELRRIDEKLARERMGGKLRVVKRTTSASGGVELPLIPLQGFVEGFRRRHRLDDEAVARELGISARTLFFWREGQRRSVRFETADTILTHAEANWWDVWQKPANGHASGRPQDVLAYIDEANVYIAACLAFEGELVE